MQAVTRAGEFFARHGREIDRARFRFHFAGGTQEEVLDALGRYQNEDGGFGHALEPDITAPASNPFATEWALLVCLQAGVPREHPLLARTVGYLEASQYEDGSWRFSPEVYAHEMAPWFQGWEWPNLNPAGSLAGLLRELGLGSPRLHGRVADLFAQLARPTDLLGDEFYGVRPYALYALPDGEHPHQELYRAGMLWWLIRQHIENKLPDAPHFFEYARTPQTYTARNLPGDILAAELERLEAEQAEDGGWPSPYAEHWRGAFTVQGLLVLRAFGRI
jgi:hypothetical protein